MEIINIKTKDNDLGSLSFFEALNDIDFDIKRIYYIYNVPKGEIRGYHAHKKLNQLLFCPFGRIMISLDDGENVEKVMLDQPNKGIVVRANTWRTMQFLEEHSVLCVAASEYYDEDDYIRDYGQFLEYIGR